MGQLARRRSEIIRYGIVGSLNTTLDFVLLLLFVSVGFDKIVANYISTSIAFLFSFFTNRSFTFRSTSGNIRKQFALFIVVTLTGLWILQPIIITVVNDFLVQSGNTKETALIISKLVATIFTLVWNYLLYSKIVFALSNKKAKI